MKHLLPFGGITDHRFGILTTPSHKGIPIGIINGMDWAADNEAFTRNFDPQRYFVWLDKMNSHRATCLFITCPDKVGDAIATIKLFATWQPHFGDWPLAFVAQDGQEDNDFPAHSLWGTLFIGGTDKFKDSQAAVECIRRAQALQKHIHVGRVNEWRRFQFFSKLEGDDEFTCDGTKHRFIGTKNAIRRWENFSKRYERQMDFGLFGSHRPG